MRSYCGFLFLKNYNINWSDRIKQPKKLNVGKSLLNYIKKIILC